MVASINVSTFFIHKVVQRSTLYSAQSCTVLKDAQCSKLHSAQSCTMLKVAQRSKLHSAQSCTALKVIQRSKLYSAQSCAVLKVAQWSKLHSAQSCTVLKVWFMISLESNIASFSYSLQLDIDTRHYYMQINDLRMLQKTTTLGTVQLCE